MTRYILQRLALLPLLMVIYSFVIFVIIQAPPGDFLTAYVATLASSGSSLSAEQIAAMRHQYGLDQPMIVQYFLWVQHLLHGDFGLSLEYQRPNAELISEMLGLTLALALFSFVLTWVLAIPAGIYSATHPRSVGDHILTVINYIGVATPNFMLALILMWVAFAYFDVSVTGLFSPDYVNAPWSWGRVADLLEHIWLPALVLGIAGTARLSRIMRANLLDELNKPYVVTARAKGMKEWRLVLRYPVRLAFNPLVSTIGWYLPQLFSGSLIVATVMNLPNIGPLLLRALVNQDMYLAGGILLIYSFLTVVGTLVSDVLLALFDPRIRVENMTDLAAGKEAEDRIAVASNWRLVWWRFRRHHLAMASAALLIVLYTVVLFPGFFATQDPERTDARQAFIPVQSVHFFADGKLSPWVPAIVGKRNPTTLRMEWKADAEQEGAGPLLRAGYPYRVLGLIPTNGHLVGPADPAQRIFLWAPTGSAAISGPASCTAPRPR